MRFACDDDLDGQSEQPLEVGEDEPGPLVRREAACEADREEIAVGAAQTSEPVLELGVHVPERLVIELEDRFPVGRRPAVPPGGRRPSAGASSSSGASHVPRWTPFVMWPIGWLRSRPEPGPHLPRNRPVQRRDAVRVRGEPERQRRQAESVRAVAAPEPEQGVVRDAGLRCEAARVAEHELVAEHLVARRDGRMGREDRRAPDVLERVPARQAAVDQHPGPLDREERRVALVDVEDGRLETERRERAHAADAEEQLLADAVLAVARVEGVREQVDVEQVEGNGGRRPRHDVVAPHVGGHRLARQLDLDRDRLRAAVRAPRDRSPYRSRSAGLRR